jgi:uncharacterized MAPEG superfamily protein
MTIPFWCLLVTIVIPYVLAGTGGYFRVRQLGALDNKHPRAQASELTGAGARAYAAQANAWEAVSVFGAAVFVSHLAGANSSTAALLSEIFVAARVLHAVTYLANLDILRSLSFGAGFACCVGLFVISA